MSKWCLFFCMLLAALYSVESNVQAIPSYKGQTGSAAFMDNDCFSTMSFVRAGAKNPTAKYPHVQGCRNKALGQRFIDTDQDFLSQLWDLFTIRPNNFVPMCTSVSVKSP